MVYEIITQNKVGFHPLNNTKQPGSLLFIAQLYTDYEKTIVKDPITNEADFMVS